jgi:hypothetical protein
MTRSWQPAASTISNRPSAYWPTASPTSSAARGKAWPIRAGGRSCAKDAAREVRQCEYKNYCEGLDQKHKDVTCQLWDRVALDEPGLVKRSRDGKRRLVAPADW